VNRALPELLRFLSALLYDDSNKRIHSSNGIESRRHLDFASLKVDEKLILEIYQYPGEKRLPLGTRTGFLRTRCATHSFTQHLRSFYKDKDTDELAFNWRKLLFQFFAEPGKFSKEP